jgi:hypothetical protein
MVLSELWPEELGREFGKLVPKGILMPKAAIAKERIQMHSQPQLYFYPVP